MFGRSIAVMLLLFSTASCVGALRPENAAEQPEERDVLRLRGARADGGVEGAHDDRAGARRLRHSS